MLQALQSQKKEASQLDRPVSSRLVMLRLLLLAAILAAFGRILFNEFVDWDDGRLIYLNTNISPKVELDDAVSKAAKARDEALHLPEAPTVHTRPHLIGLLRQWNWNDPNTNNMYNPLVYSFWWLLAQAATVQVPDILDAWLNPAVFHGANLVVHWLTACLVLEILRKLGMRDWPAAIGALLFAVHPLQTEAVAWATGMKDLLSGFLAIAAIWRYLAAVQSQGSRQRNNYIVATLLFLASLFAKPSTVVVPVIVAAIDLLHFRRPWRQVARWVVPWFLLTPFFIILAEHIQPTPGLILTPLWTRPLVVLDTFAFYLYKLAVPLYLSFDYGRTPAALMHEPALHYALYWTWILPVTVAIVLRKLNRRDLTLAAIIFAIVILPVSGITPFNFQFYSTVADRFVYMAMLGVALAAAWVMTKYSNRGMYLGATIILTVLTCLSFVQAGVWQDSESLYKHAAESMTRGSAVHYAILGQYKDRVAHAAWRRAIQAQSVMDQAEYQRQWALRNQLFDEAIDDYTHSMNLEPTDGIIYDQLGAALFARQRWDDLIEVTRRRIEIQVRLPTGIREDQDKLHYMLGSLYAKRGRYPEAVAEFEKSLQYKADPDVSKFLEQLKKKLNSSTQAATLPIR